MSNALYKMNFSHSILVPLLLALGCNWLNPSLLAQQVDDDYDWQTAYQPLAITNGTLTGPGAEQLLDACQQSHFVLFGEAHGVAGVAELVTATHRSLPDEPFYHLVIEAGDWFTQQLTDGDSDELLSQYPYSLAFDYNGDLALIEHLKSAGAERHDVVIGVDQESCAIHPFGFLAKEASSYSARQLAKCLHLKSLFQSGKYIRTDHQEDLKALAGHLS